MTQQRITSLALILTLLSCLNRITISALSTAPITKLATKSAVSKNDLTITRRSIINQAFGLAACLSASARVVPPANAVSGVENFARENLLRSIRSSKSDDKVMEAIEQIVSVQPTRENGSTLAKDLDGEWVLLWSIKADAFSPLLKLPKPFKPDSYQYFGRAADLEVGSNRVAQGLTGGILGPKQLWLSSGVVPVPEKGDPGMLEIRPPFRFEVGGRYGTGEPKVTIVEAGSDAEFRKANARTTDAQNAPKNRYRQLYWEGEGKGSLRISTITEGDPVIVGAVFVHQKL